MALFESLSEKLQNALRNMRGKGRVTEKDVKELMREIKLALLEADVNYKVVKDFVNKVSERAVGQDVLESLTPGQQVIKVVHDELIALLGGTSTRTAFSSEPPTIYMMVGLQGSGKTTTTGKLAGNFKKQGKSPLLAACDVYRPAAVKQLQIVGSQVGVPVFSIEGSKDPVSIAKAAVSQARKSMNDMVLLDTAGRLQMDEALMDELLQIKKTVKPNEILLVIDSMTGQDAVNVAQGFNDKIGVDGIILTKLDSDTRGGAALSVKAVTGKPIKFVGTGEKLTDLEQFHPDRMASRILGMGDVLSLIDKAQENFNEKKALELEKKLRSSKFTLEDFLDQMQEMKKMGPMDQILGMLPGMNNKMLGNVDIDERKLGRTEAIIKSMTSQERNNPEIINSSRKKRISAGSGTSVQDVNRLLKDFDQMQKMLKNLSNMNARGKRGFGGFKLPF
ncbi:MAG: signal recognition particle protein [Eubacteriales bacterium]|nr:signal recognition particle protein [Eubacteriales bacterium]